MLNDLANIIHVEESVGKSNAATIVTLILFFRRATHQSRLRDAQNKDSSNKYRCKGDSHLNAKSRVKLTIIMPEEKENATNLGVVIPPSATLRFAGPVLGADPNQNHDS